MPRLGAAKWELVFRGPEFQFGKMSKPWRRPWGPAATAVSLLSEPQQPTVVARRQEKGHPPNDAGACRPDAMTGGSVTRKTETLRGPTPLRISPQKEHECANTTGHLKLTRH